MADVLHLFALCIVYHFEWWIASQWEWSWWINAITVESDWRKRGQSILDNDQLMHTWFFTYFTIHLLQSSTCFEHYMLTIRRLNCTDAASGIILSVSGRPVQSLGENCRAVLSQTVHRTATDWEDNTRCCISTIQPPDDEHIMLETCRAL